MKYVVFRTDEGRELIFTFPKSIDHDRFAESMRALRSGPAGCWERKLIDAEVVGAGFIDSNLRCYGKSETLRKESRGKVDTALLIISYNRTT